jgi:hypothetical protein
MRVKNRNQFPRPRMPTNLEGTLRQNRRIGRASGSSVFERPNALLDPRLRDAWITLAKDASLLIFLM